MGVSIGCVWPIALHVASPKIEKLRGNTQSDANLNLDDFIVHDSRRWDHLKEGLIWAGRESDSVAGKLEYYFVVLGEHLIQCQDCAINLKQRSRRCFWYPCPADLVRRVIQVRLTMVDGLAIAKVHRRVWRRSSRYRVQGVS